MEIEITVWVGDNAATDMLQRLTPEGFTAESGISVNFVEGTRQELFESDSSGSRLDDIDVLLISSPDPAQFGVADGSTLDLASLAEDDLPNDIDLDDIFPAVRSLYSLENETGGGSPLAGERLYAVPFFADTSILIYNQEIIDGAGVAVPDQPTWAEVAAIAEQVHTDEVAGICLNRAASAESLGASLTTVVNTFGGTWWEANEDGTPVEAQINQPDSGFRAATEFYIELLQNFGQDKPNRDVRCES